jgi:hypothetical protein
LPSFYRGDRYAGSAFAAVVRACRIGPDIAGPGAERAGGFGVAQRQDHHRRPALLDCRGGGGRRAQIQGSIAAFLDAIEDIDKTVRPIRPLRWTIVHADQLDARDVVRMRALGMRVSINHRPTVIFDDLVAAQRDKPRTCRR